MQNYSLHVRCFQVVVEVEGFVEAIGIPDLFFGAVEFPMATVDDAVMV